MPHNTNHDVSPSKNSFPEKKKGESFNEAMNKPNNPKVSQELFDKCFNVNDVYDGDKSDDDY